MARTRRRQRWTAVPRQDGRTVVVTGATSGIGLQTARILAAFGAHVVLAVRNPEKGEAVARELPGSTEVRRLDVSDLASVRSFAEETGPVDVLVNNAGIMAVPFARSADGFESQLATNHLGHFALTNLLLPKLTDRVVVVGSAAHRSGRDRPRGPELGAPRLPGLCRLRAVQARQPAVPGRAATAAHGPRVDLAGHRRAPRLHLDGAPGRHGQPGVHLDLRPGQPAGRACRPGRAR